MSCGGISENTYSIRLYSAAGIVSSSYLYDMSEVNLVKFWSFSLITSCGEHNKYPLSHNELLPSTNHMSKL